MLYFFFINVLLVSVILFFKFIKNSSVKIQIPVKDLEYWLTFNVAKDWFEVYRPDSSALLDFGIKPNELSQIQRAEWFVATQEWRRLFVV